MSAGLWICPNLSRACGCTAGASAKGDGVNGIGLLIALAGAELTNTLLPDEVLAGSSAPKSSRLRSFAYPSGSWT